MKNCSAIDTDDILFKVIHEAKEGGALNITGGVYPNGERPDDSKKEDIVISTITLTHEKPQNGTSNVNIYASDKKLKINGKEQTKADRERLREIGDAVTELLDAANIPDLEFWIEADTVIDTAVNQHYRNIRIGWNIH